METLNVHSSHINLDGAQNVLLGLIEVHQEVLESVVPTKVLRELDQIKVTLHNRIIQQIFQHRVVLLVCKE